MHTDFKQLLNLVLIFFLFVLIVTMLYVGKSFLVPLTLAGILAMLLHKICIGMEKRGIPRSIASFLSVFTLFLGFAIIIVLIGWQLSGFMDNMNTFKQEASQATENLANWLQKHFNINIQPEQDQSSSSVPISAETGKTILMLASKTTSIFIDAILVFVYIFLFLLFRSRIKNFILMIVQNEHREKARLILHKSTFVAQHYLEGLTKMIVTLWILYGIGFSLVGVESALFFAIACGLLEIVPFVGNLLGTLFTILAVLVQGAGSETIIGVVAVYMTVQFVQTYILEPWIVGSQVRINPLFTIIGLVAGELIWGIAGMVLTIPLLGILRIIFDHIPTMKPYAYLIGSEAKKSPSLMQRLRAMFSASSENKTQ